MEHGPVGHASTMKSPAFDNAGKTLALAGSGDIDHVTLLKKIYDRELISRIDLRRFSLNRNSRTIRVSEESRLV